MGKAGLSLVARRGQERWGCRRPFTAAMFLVEQHHFSNSLGHSHALITATAMNHGLPLLTANTKHYRMIKNLLLKKFLP